MKNGVMGMFALMVIYGMFIPNDPRTHRARGADNGPGHAGRHGLL